MACKVFISYRRKDHAALAEWLFNLLSQEIEAGDVFFDRDAMNPGDVFTDRIQQAVREAPTFVALVGPRWNEVIDDRPRLENPQDVVRQEIAFALELKAVDPRRELIPVLCDGVVMPAMETLPLSLQSFAGLHAPSLDPNQLQRTLQDLASKIITRVDHLDKTPEAEKWLIKQIAALLPGDPLRVQQIGKALANGNPGMFGEAPAAPLAVARALYETGPLGIKCLTSFVERGDRRIKTLVDLLATKWINAERASSLRHALVDSRARVSAAIRCDYPEFTPDKLLLKASQDGTEWPSILVKTSDDTREIIRQIEETLSLWFLRSPGELSYEEINRRIERYRASGTRLPFILRLDHKAALDDDLIHQIQHHFPSLHVLVHTADFEELGGQFMHCEPYLAVDDEDTAYFDYIDARRHVTSKEYEHPPA